MIKEFECHNEEVSGRRCGEQCKDCKIDCYSETNTVEELVSALEDLWPRATNGLGEHTWQEVQADECLKALSTSIDNAKALVEKYKIN